MGVGADLPSPYSPSGQARRIAARLDSDVELCLLSITGSEDEIILRQLC